MIRGEGLRQPPNASSAPHPNLLPARGAKGPVGARPENFPRHAEKVKSAPGVSPPVAALAERGDAVNDRVYKRAGADDRPENPAQHLEKVKSAPEFVPLAPRERGEDWPPDLIRGEGLRQPPNASSAPHPNLLPARGAKGPVGARPENFPQHAEKVKSAPGVSPPVAALAERGDAVDDRVYKAADPVSTPDLVLSLLRSAPGRQVFRSCLSTLRAGTYGVASLGGGDFPYPAPTGTGRPENLAQGIEKIDSAPGTDGFDEAGCGSLPSPLIPCPIRPGRFPMTLGGVGAC